jgi:hypothetical protein
MVRAVKRENGPSGSYYNLSQGAFSHGVAQGAAVNSDSRDAVSLRAFVPGDVKSHKDFIEVVRNGQVGMSQAIDIAFAAANVPSGTDRALFSDATNPDDSSWMDPYRAGFDAGPYAGLNEAIDEQFGSQRLGVDFADKFNGKKLVENELDESLQVEFARLARDPLAPRW